MDGPQPGDERVWLDTPAWIAWLDAATTTRFAYPLFDPGKGYIVGVMTVRKERRMRGGRYWTAYRRADGHLRKVYVGGTSAVTQARLRTLARTLMETTGGTDTDQWSGWARVTQPPKGRKSRSIGP